MKFKMYKEEELQIEILDKYKTIYGSVCKLCTDEVTLENNKNFEYFRCSNKFCELYKKNVGIWKDTVFENCKIDKIIFLRIVELWLMNSPNKLISYITGQSQQCVSRIINKVSKLLTTKFYSNLNYIGESNEIIEIDESKFGKRKYNKGHPVEGVWVFGMLERHGSKKVMLFQVDDRTKSTLQLKIKKHVKENSMVYSDCWKGYGDLHEKGYKHRTVNHSKFFKDPVTGVHTNTIEGT